MTTVPRPKASPDESSPAAPHDPPDRDGAGGDRSLACCSSPVRSRPGLAGDAQPAAPRRRPASWTWAPPRRTRSWPDPASRTPAPAPCSRETSGSARHGVIAGFPPGTVTGTIHDKDAAAEAAQADRQAAYDDVAAQTGGTAVRAVTRPGRPSRPGVYTTRRRLHEHGHDHPRRRRRLERASSSSRSGRRSAPRPRSKVVLTDGALANNVYWQVVGAVSLGAGRQVRRDLPRRRCGHLRGRRLAQGPRPHPEHRRAGQQPLHRAHRRPDRAGRDHRRWRRRAPRTTPTPTISGTTDEPAGRTVTVTVGGQTLTTTVGAGGAWGVSADALAAGTARRGGVGHRRVPEHRHRDPGPHRRRHGTGRDHRRRRDGGHEGHHPDDLGHHRRAG